jgi:hypothetical protein
VLGCKDSAFFAKVSGCDMSGADYFSSFAAAAHLYIIRGIENIDQGFILVQMWLL